MEGLQLPTALEEKRPLPAGPDRNAAAPTAPPPEASPRAVRLLNSQARHSPVSPAAAGSPDGHEQRRLFLQLNHHHRHPLLRNSHHAMNTELFDCAK